MESVFTRIMNGEEPGVILFQDETCGAILETNPILPGHTVVFPRRVTDAFFDLEPKVLSELMLRCQRIACVLKAAVPCDKIAVLVYGIQTRHAHVHLIPVRGDSGEINLDKPRTPADPAALGALARQLRALLRDQA